MAHVLYMMQNKYQGPGDVVDIKFDEQGELKVIGFRNETVKNEI